MKFSPEQSRLIHALQIHPRISWAALSPILGQSPRALADSWREMASQGLAWVTAAPTRDLQSGRAGVALVDVDIDRSHREETIEILKSTPGIAAIDRVARGRDIVLTVTATSFARLADFIVDELSQTPGVLRTRSHLGVRTHVDGSAWRIGALTRDQIQEVEKLTPPVNPSANPPYLSETEQEIYEALLLDGRVPASQLAEQTGKSESTIRRLLSSVLRRGDLTLRCEVAQSATTSSITTLWWCRLPSASRPKAIEAVKNDPRVRMCISLSGPANFVVLTWLKDMAEVIEFEQALETWISPGYVTDNSIVLRTVKRNGRILRVDGTSTSVVTAMDLGPSVNKQLDHLPEI